MKRLLYLLHRWAGIALAAVMALWFLSGMVMLYVGYPKLTPAEQLQGQAVLTAGPDCCVPMADALAASGLREPTQWRLMRIGGELRYVFGDGRKAAAAVDARSGRRVPPTDADAALASAAEFAAGAPVRWLGEVQEDAWTHSRALDAHRPLQVVAVDEPAGRWLYVSGRTGEVVRDASRTERTWGWVGAWLHWLYIVRGGPLDAWWTEIIIVLSLAGTVGAVTGDDVTGDGLRFGGGTGTEDVSTLIAAIEADDLWFKRIVVSSLDVTNLGRWETFADTQNGPMVGKPSALVLGHVGTQAAAIAISKTQLNHEAFEVLHGYDWETPAAEFAACHAIDRVLTERAGPEGWNTSYSGSILPGVKPARDKSKRAVAHSTQKAALQNGLSPLTTTAAGETQLVRAIWSRCQNSDGSPNYLGLDVAEWTVLQENREGLANDWRFWRTINPHVRDNFGKEPTVPGVATPDGWKVYAFSQRGQAMVAARVFESLPTIRAAYNRTTKRIQWEFDFTRMPLHEQSEGVVTSLG